jgi:hypothetical protein
MFLFRIMDFSLLCWCIRCSCGQLSNSDDDATFHDGTHEQLNVIFNVSELHSSQFVSIC